ncbi:MAG: phosphate ABC transporter permease subunit PstC [Caldilineaceae bacterium]
MLRKAVLIQALFFSAAAVLVITSAALIGFIGSQGFQVFRYISPAEFFLATTWNPHASRDGLTAEPIVSTEAPVAAPTPENGAPTDGQSVEGGQLIEPSEPVEGGQLIEPSEPVEGGQLIEPSEPVEGGQLIEPSEPVEGGQLIEPSEPVEGGQLIEPSEPVEGGQLIEPSQPAEGGQLVEPSEPVEGGDGATGGQIIEPSAVTVDEGAESTAAASADTELSEGVFGVLPLLAGSLLTALLTLLISGPLAILVAIFMVEVAPEPMRRFMRTIVEIFASLPSVIFGLLGLIYVVPWVRVTFDTGLGKGILAAALVLVFMTQPTIVTIAEDVLRNLPASLREAAWGIGATRWQLIWGVLLPAARPGLMTAIILGMGRAIGETMAVQMVIGNITEYIPTSFVTGATTMPAAIVTQLPEASSPAHRAALIMVGFVLLIVAFLLIALTRLSVRNTPVQG